jgi:tripartite-type tricarboxylate transporter receptor subunit TctC
VNAAFGIALPYDSFKDLAPVARFVDLPLLLAANNEAPFKSVGELLAGPKSGKTIPYASAGIGSIPHLWGEYLKARTGLPLEHVGYKGSAEALRDVMAGHVPLFSDVLMPTAAPVRAGKLRGLAVAMAARSALLPEVPTVGEAGLAGMEGAVPFGISTTGGTPADLVERLNAAVNEALGDEGVRRKLQELGFIPIGGTAAFYAQSLVEETAKWRKVIEESKIPAPA